MKAVVLKDVGGVIQADASTRGTIANAINTAAIKFGKIDILVNNAAISIAGPLELAADRLAAYSGVNLTTVPTQTLPLIPR